MTVEHMLFTVFVALACLVLLTILAMFEIHHLANQLQKMFYEEEMRYRMRTGGAVMATPKDFPRSKPTRRKPIK